MIKSRFKFVTSFFFTVCEPCTHLETRSFYSAFGGRFEPTALIFPSGIRCFFFRGGHDPITHAHRARCLALLRHLFNECCHCRFHSHCHCHCHCHCRCRCRCHCCVFKVQSHTMWVYMCLCCGLFAPTQFHFECCGVLDDS